MTRNLTTRPLHQWPAYIAFGLAFRFCDWALDRVVTEWPNLTDSDPP